MGDKKNIRRICEAAEEAFWAKVAELVPQAKTGDLAPDADIPFRKACMEVVRAWLDENLPGADAASARCDLIVEMRPPKQGERGWMVEALTAEDALAEVLKESEELGWVADRDHAPGFDDEGMQPVTILFKPAVPQGLTTSELMSAQGFPRCVNCRGDKVVVVETDEIPCPECQPDKYRVYCDDVGIDPETGERHDVKAEVFPIPPPGDPERIHEDDVWGAFVDEFPHDYHGWKATWEYPGYIRWNHPDLPMFVIATPDFHRSGEIAIDVQDNYGRSYPFGGADVLWPVGANRTPATYLTVIGQVLEKISALPYRTQQALDDYRTFTKAHQLHLRDTVPQTDEVHVLVYHHRHGEDVSVYDTEAHAKDAAVGCVREYLGEIPNASQRKRITAMLAKERNDDAIEAFEIASDERLDIHQATIQRSTK